MAFESLSDFMTMCIDGRCHGLYVWSAYAIGFGVILFNVLSPMFLRKRLVTEFKRKQRREKV